MFDMPCFAVQIAQLAVTRFDLPDIDFGMMGEDVLPPSLTVYFLQMDMDSLLIL